MSRSLLAHGNPAIVGSGKAPFRPVALRSRLSSGGAFVAVKIVAVSFSSFHSFVSAPAAPCRVALPSTVAVLRTQRRGWQRPVIAAKPTLPGLLSGREVIGQSRNVPPGDQRSA